ncbi:hypothetical protein [Fusibacter ferrireducens]|uniref:Uncharacterized protein n=1 Tax=Fusibacter ferrireducens TaxID=2785058 RepID=A0ABR9ZZ81_9FIRM|nr:hypothetical protein [Fusibacter ferrireducens]MBF4695768.1 hypothetical protein [Fusibacter ferrireducens]
MNRTFKRFKTRQYITKKWGILLLSFIITIGATSMPVSADSLAVTNPVDKPFDINDINDIEHPIIILPVSYPVIRLGQDYPISITIKDNKGIQDVTVICYTRTHGGTSHQEHKMTLNTLTGKYEYTLPADQISKNTVSMMFFFTATDLVGLKTTGYTPDIDMSSDPNAKPITTTIESSYAPHTMDHIFGRKPNNCFTCFNDANLEDFRGEDIHIINPTDYPVVALSTYASPARSNYIADYPLSVIAEDNKGIQEVTIDYRIDDKNFHNLKMSNTWSADGSYEFNIPKEQIPDTNSTIYYTITATNLDGLKTATDELTIPIIPGERLVKVDEAGIPINFGKPLATVNDFKMSLFGHSDKDTSQNYNALLHLPSDVSTIKKVLSLDEDTQNVTVAGQIDYFATDSEHPIIQAIIDGSLHSLYINGSLGDNIKLGHQVILTGDYHIENGLPMLKNIASNEIIGYATPKKPELVNIEYLKTHSSNRLGRFVKIKNVKLGTNHPNGLTEITDETGSISLYKSTYPEQIKAGDTVDLYAIVTCTDSTVQLRTGTIKANGYNLYDKLDGKPTLSIVPSNPLSPQRNEDYHIQASAKDIDGIQKVTISYTIGNETISNQQMTQNNYNQNYDYTIPRNRFLGNIPNFTFTITATDTNGLTTSKTTTISIDDEIKILEALPIQNTISSGKSLDIIIQFTNGGATPKVTYIVEKDNKILLTEGENITGAGVSFYRLGTVSAGNYTVNATIVRTEDGKELHHEWHFTISE